MPIILSNPITINETFNLLRIKSLLVQWTDGNKPARASYTVTPYAQDEYGVITDAPTSNMGIVTDLLETAAERAADGKAKLAIAVQAVLDALQELEHEKGNI